MTASLDPLPPSDAIETAAADWFARRDRGLSEAEARSYATWLQENPRHGETIARMEQAWRSIDPVFEPALLRGAPPDPDLLAPGKWHRKVIWGLVTAAAAAAALFFFPLHVTPPAPAVVAEQVIIHAAPQRLVLEDGSTVDLRGSARVEVRFTPAERHLHLVSGEAFFNVAKNPSRPFTVTADHFAVRAVGTAFSVSLGAREIAVLVTEGRVGMSELNSDSPDSISEPVPLAAGQKGVAPLKAGPVAGTTFKPRTTQLSPDQIDRAMLWQGVQLEFADLPLSTIVAAFNRYNRVQLVIGDAPTAKIRMGGIFRADHAESFVRLLGTGFGVKVTREGDFLFLRQSNVH